MKKTLKNKIIALTATASMLVSASAVANAETRDIGLMLNGKYVDFADQAPANIDGRVLVPVRAVMENMDARVSWNESDRTIDVVKDGKTVSMQIDNPVIKVDGTEKTIDVAPQIINDRTLLPIRAVVEEFDCTVGWDDSVKSVIVINWDDYMNSIKNNASNFYKFAEEQGSNIPKNYIENMSAKFTFTIDDKSADNNDFKISADISTDTKAKDEIIDSTAVVSMDLKDLDEYIKKAGLFNGDSSIDLSKLDTFSAEVIVDNMTMYIKTDLVNKLADAVNDPSLTAVKAIISDRTWLKIDFSELYGSYGLSGLDKMMTGTMDKPVNVIEVMEDMGKNVDYSDINSAIMVDSIANVFANVYSDKYFKYDKTDGGYTVSFKMGSNEFIDFIKSMVDFPDTSAMDAVKFNMSFDVKGSDDGSFTSDMNMDFTLDLGEADIQIVYDAKSDCSAGGFDGNIEIPVNSLDIAEMLNGMLTIK